MATNNMRKLREATGMSQSELARRIGTTPSTVNRLENGQRRFSQQYIEAIARVLSVAPGDLIGTFVATVSKDALIPIVGEVSAKNWRIPPTGEMGAHERLSCILPPKYSGMAGGAHLITDDHAPVIGPRGTYAVTVPYNSMRKTETNGDWAVIRSFEGKLTRTAIAQLNVIKGEATAIVDGEEIRVGRDHLAVDLVVAVYRELST
jgi:transcriptional regulator with XRE-family HTH domain